MDWKKIVSEIIESGITQRELANMLSISQPLVSQILSGKRGRKITWEVGEKLLTLHFQVTRRSHKKGYLK